MRWNTNLSDDEPPQEKDLEAQIDGRNGPETKKGHGPSKTIAEESAATDGFCNSTSSGRLTLRLRWEKGKT
jgi:hypothetical protein